MSRRKIDLAPQGSEPVPDRLSAHRELLTRAAELSSNGLGEQVPTERQLLSLLKDSGLAPAIADRLEVQFDKRARTKARADLAAQRLVQVETMSRQGMSVGKIAEQLGLSYGHVVHLRTKLDVPRSRTRA